MNQISMFEIMAQAREPVTVPRPQAGEKVYVIPDDVWENRCRYCAHKHAKENRPIPISIINKCFYENVIPCQILSICKPDRMPGECLSFTPYNVYGLCCTCEHDNMFCEGFCRKPDHAPERRVCYGGNYGGDERNVDYWGRHRFSVCDDYTPNGDNLVKMEGEHESGANDSPGA